MASILTAEKCKDLKAVANVCKGSSLVYRHLESNSLVSRCASCVTLKSTRRSVPDGFLGQETCGSGEASFHANTLICLVQAKLGEDR